jgi:ubiquinone/menaquinone biosynthesis C-methylase UbiE
MPSQFYDELWQLRDPAEPPSVHKVEFVRGLGPARAALDFGCGDGQLTRELAAAEVTAADVSLVALKRARANVPGVTLVVLDQAAPLPFPDESFDLVLCADTLEYVEDLPRTLSELRRVLALEGRLALTTPMHSRMTGLEVLARGFDHRFDPLGPPTRLFSRASLERLLELAGLDRVALSSAGGTLFAVAAR